MADGQESMMELARLLDECAQRMKGDVQKAKALGSFGIAREINLGVFIVGSVADAARKAAQKE